MEKQIKVLNVMPDFKKGGVQSEVMYPARILDRSQVHFDAMLLSDTVGYYEEEFRNYGHIYRIPLQKKKTKVGRALSVITNFFYIKKRMSVFFRKHQDYDAVHARDPFLNAPVLWAAYDAGIPVRIAHCAVDKPGKDFKNRLYIDIYLRICALLICKFSTHRFGVTKSAVEYMFGRGNGIVMKNPTIALDKFNPELYSYQPDGTIRLLMVGSYSTRKNQKFAVRILRELTDRKQKAELTFIGYPRNAKETYLPELKRDVRKYGLKDKVRFLPQDADIPYEMSKATFLLIPSLQEGLPNVALEAQAMGLPCLVSRNVSDECNCGLCTFIELSVGASGWADRIEAIIRENGFDRRYLDMSQWDNRKISQDYLEYWRGKPMRIQ